jgi:hypothetical protein
MHETPGVLTHIPESIIEGSPNVPHMTKKGEAAVRRYEFEAQDGKAAYAEAMPKVLQNAEKMKTPEGQCEIYRAAIAKHKKKISRLERMIDNIESEMQEA